MKHSLQTDTLAFQLGIRPSVQFRDISSRSLIPVVNQMVKYLGAAKFNCFGEEVIPGVPVETPLGDPERDAVMFYLLNHAMGLVRQQVHPLEPLGKFKNLVDSYHWHLTYRSVRMFYYLLIICTRESRHEKTAHSEQWWKELVKAHGGACTSFQASIKNSGSGGAVDKLKDNPPTTTIGNYAEFLCRVFDEGKYSPGYGGIAWGKVAHVLRDFVIGKITAEMMMDTAFTLCHNNGPIFNKGVLFSSYSNHIYKILDVQRSGQVPQLVGNNETNWGADPAVKQAWSMCHDLFPDEFSGYVDWYKVEELGSMHKYSTEKGQQVSKYGHPAKSKVKDDVIKLKQAAAEAKAEAEASMWVQIMPGVSVKKEVRE